MNDKHRKQVAICCLEGLEIAAKKYKQWSGGVSLRSAPESLTHIFLAENLEKLLRKNCKWPKLITLEEKPKDLIHASGFSAKKKLNKRIERGRIDITVWNEEKKPWLIFEIKRHSGYKSINKDVDRINELFKYCSSVDAGFVIVVTQAKREKTLEKRLQITAEMSVTKRLSCKRPQVKNSTAKTKKEIDMYQGVECFIVERTGRPAY